MNLWFLWPRPNGTCFKKMEFDLILSQIFVCFYVAWQNEWCGSPLNSFKCMALSEFLEYIRSHEMYHSFWNDLKQQPLPMEEKIEYNQIDCARYMCSTILNRMDAIWIQKNIEWNFSLSIYIYLLIYIDMHTRWCNCQ